MADASNPGPPGGQGTRPGDLRLMPKDTGILLIDVQDKACAAMPSGEIKGVIRNWAALAEMACRFHFPVAVSEQYREQLGRTLPLLVESLGHLTPPPRFIDKLEFSCWSNPLLQQFVLDSGRRTWLVAGIEAHVAVYQTIRDLREEGLRVHVVSDAVISRTRPNLAVGLSLIEKTGAIRTSTEAAFFDLMGRVGDADYKALVKLLR